MVIQYIFTILHLPLLQICFVLLRDTCTHTINVLYKFVFETQQSPEHHLLRLDCHVHRLLPPPAYYPPLLFSFITMINGGLVDREGKGLNEPATSPPLATGKCLQTFLQSL